MYETVVTPNFCDIDGLRHVNNTRLPQWFELARLPLFRICNPDLSLETWNLILAHFSLDFVAQLRLGTDVVIRTEVSKIGRTSFTVRQEALQDGQVAVRASTVLVHYDFAAQKPVPLTESYRAQLAQHMPPEDKP